MKVFFPHIGVEMPSIRMAAIGRRMEINVDITHVGRPRIRKSAPGMEGIPHQEYAVRLFPITDKYRLLRVPPVAPLKPRRAYAVCWHAHKNFMVRLFDEFDNATIRTIAAEYEGFGDFLDKYRATKGPFYHSGKVCQCTGSRLAVWEDESHLKPRW